MSINDYSTGESRQDVIQSPIKANEEKIHTGEISDGYHTFAELYYQRAILFACLCQAYKDKAFVSKRHADGTFYPDMFIAGLKTPDGNYTFHIEDEFFHLFEGVREYDYAPTWDGHTPKDVHRLLLMSNK